MFQTSHNSKPLHVRNDLKLLGSEFPSSDNYPSAPWFESRQCGKLCHGVSTKVATFSQKSLELLTLDLCMSAMTINYLCALMQNPSRVSGFSTFFCSVFLAWSFHNSDDPLDNCRTLVGFPLSCTLSLCLSAMTINYI